MSNHLAVAAVTSTLRYVLERAIESSPPGPVGGAQVSTVRLDQLGAGDVNPTPRLNLLLYQVTPNHAGNLEDLPTRTSAGRLTRRPNAALDLHYLLTGFGSEDALEGQRLLALGILALAASPVLTRDTISAAIARYQGTADTAFLSAADLADQPELVKLSQLPLSIEDLTRLWGMFPQAPFQLSVAYRATVAVIEADVPTRAALPVRTRSLRVDPGLRIVLESAAGDPPESAVVAGSTVVVKGSGLLPGGTTVTQVELGGRALAPLAGGTPAEVRVEVTDDVPAGVLVVRVRQVRPSPGPGVPARDLGSSNALPLVVAPTVVVHAVDADTVTLGIRPRLRAGQRAVVRLDALDGADAEPVVLAQPPLADGSAPVSQLELAREDVPDGAWLVRVEVDGVSSVPALVGDVYGEPRLELL